MTLAYRQMSAIFVGLLMTWMPPGSERWVFLIGVIWALIMRATRPDVYAAIGRGAEGRMTLMPEDPFARVLHADPVGARSYPY